ncbi:MAG TPA: MMPL family transporter [Chloroflexota bacterium]
MSFLALGYRVYRWRWGVVAVWALLLLAALPLAPRAASAFKVGGFSNPQIESARARDALEAALGFHANVLLVIFRHPEWKAEDPRFVAEVDRALADVRTMPGVERVVGYLDNPRQVGTDHHTAYVLLALDLLPDQFQRILPEVQSRLRSSALEMTVAGPPAFYRDIEQISQRDLRRAEMISFPFALIALLLVFGSVVAAGVPVAVGGASVAVTLALLFGIARQTDMSIFVLNMATMLGLGLGIDYSLFMTSRFREELRHQPVADAVAVTVATAGRAVFFSGLTVLVGLLGLMTFDFMMLRSLGIGGAVVVGVSVLAAVTLLPAILAIVGRRMEAFAVPWPRLLWPRRLGAGFWAWLAARVMAHPVAVFLPVLAVLLLLGWPFLHVRFSSPDASILPADAPSRRGYDLLRTEWGQGQIDPILVAVRTPGDVISPDGIDRLYDFTRAVAADPRVARVDSIVNVDPRITREQYYALYAYPQRAGDLYVTLALPQLARGDTTLVQVYSRYSPIGPEAKDLVRTIRAMGPSYGLNVLVDGGAAEVLDVVTRLYGEFPRAILLIMLTTYIVLFALFRSAVLPLKAIVMNTLSILASYGALVFVFQDGHFSRWLGFTPLGFVEASLPIVMFCMLFGLSMDYEVFLLTRVKEAYDQTGDNTHSVAEGLERSGRIITSAALIIVVVSLSFVAADIVLIKALGLGVALAIFLDATVVRALLVPATMRLLGRWNWWAPAIARPAHVSAILGPAATPPLAPAPRNGQQQHASVTSRDERAGHSSGSAQAPATSERSGDDDSSVPSPPGRGLG